MKVPFCVLVDEEEAHGSDSKIYYKTHTVTIEHYTETNEDKNHEKIEEFLQKKVVDYQKRTFYISTERLFMTVFDLKDKIIEKI